MRLLVSATDEQQLFLFLFSPIEINCSTQLIKYLSRYPATGDSRSGSRRDHRLSRACGFRRRTPNHGLFTQFRHRLGEEAYQLIFNQLTEMLIESGVMNGKVVAVDSTHIVAYSARAMDNATGRSDPDARVGRGRRGFVLDYRVHTVCCADSELPIAFKVAPCNDNDKLYFEPLLERVRHLGVGFRHVVADSQYNSENVRTRRYRVQKKKKKSSK